MKLVSFSLLILFLADEAATAPRFRRTDIPKNPIVIGKSLNEIDFNTSCTDQV